MSSMCPEDDFEDYWIQQTEVRVCRTKGCGLDAADPDAFCSDCREEIEAAREMVRRRFIIHGIHNLMIAEIRGTYRFAGRDPLRWR